MDKKAIITAIMEAFEEIDILRAENEAWHYSAIDRGKDREIYEYGRRRLLEDYTPYARGVQTIDGEPQPFEAWIAARFYTFPDFMSRNDFMAEYDEELRAIYACELAKMEAEHGEAEA